MKIQHPTHNIWRKKVEPGDTLIFSGKKLKRLNSLLTKIEENNITHTFKPLDKDFLDWFVPKYEELIRSKENGVVHDVAEKTLYKEDKAFPYFALEIKCGEKIVGGTIFSSRTKSANIAYKYYDYSWPNESLQLGPTLYSEHLVYEWAKENEKEYISMGKDSNPYGLNASIGLAEYKLSIGYKPFFPINCPVVETELEGIKTESLFLHTPKEGERELETATLLIYKENESKFSRLLSYDNLVKISIEYID